MLAALCCFISIIFPLWLLKMINPEPCQKLKCYHLLNWPLRNVLLILFFVFPPVSSVHPSKKNRQTCVRKSLICAFAMAFIISVMLIAANQMLRNGME